MPLLIPNESHLAYLRSLGVPELGGTMPAPEPAAPPVATKVPAPSTAKRPKWATWLYRILFSLLA